MQSHASAKAQAASSEVTNGGGRGRFLPHLLRKRGRAADLAMPVPRFIGGGALLLLADVADGYLRVTFSGRVSYASSEIRDPSDNLPRLQSVQCV